MLAKFDGAVVTGVSGELGQAIVEKLKSENFKVYGIDKDGDGKVCDRFYCMDLQNYVNDGQEVEGFRNDFQDWVADKSLRVLINNAAYQYVTAVHPIDVTEFKKSLDVNLLAPYYLTVELSRFLEDACGMVLNVSSIHARLSKRDFLAYATTKAALSSMTKSLALVYGNKFRVNCIEPAAIETQMLRAGFNGDVEKLAALSAYHPSNCIGNPGEISDLIYELCTTKSQFLNGSIVDVSGGISGRLHDPD